MNTYRSRRVLRRGEALETATASLLIDAPAGSERGAGLNEMLGEARREGYDEGYRAASAEAAAAQAAGAAAQLRRMADALSHAAADLARARQEVIDAASVEAAELAYQLATAFLQRELECGPLAVEAVARAVHMVPEGQDLVVRVHPDDLFDPSEVQQLVPDVAVSVVPDPRVEGGGCVVTAGPCRVDTQVGSALERAREVLKEFYPDACLDDPGDGDRPALSPVELLG